MVESLDAFVAGQMRRWTVPGVAIGILKDGRRSHHAFGVTSVETTQPVRPDTLFQIGSISKVFCATLVMTLWTRAGSTSTHRSRRTCPIFGWPTRPPSAPSHCATR